MDKQSVSESVAWNAHRAVKDALLKVAALSERTDTLVIKVVITAAQQSGDPLPGISTKKIGGAECFYTVRDDHAVRREEGNQ